MTETKELVTQAAVLVDEDGGWRTPQFIEVKGLAVVFFLFQPDPDLLAYLLHAGGWDGTDVFDVALDDFIHFLLQLLAKSILILTPSSL